MSTTTSNQVAPSRRRPIRLYQIGSHLFITVMLLLSLIPTYLLITWSFKNGLQYRWERWSISFPLRWSNYAAAWEIVGDYMINTIIVAIIGLMGMLLLSLIGGYVFARMDFPFRQTLYYAIIALLMVPWVLSFIPAYMVYVRFGLLNSRWALIIPELAGGPIFGIFLMRAFIAGIPEELFESARCDGAGVLDLIGRITLPLSLPGLATLAVLDFPFRQTLYYAIIALLMVPWVLSFIPAYMVYVRLGLLNSRWALIIPELAGGPIFGIFLMRAFIAGIPEELFESARCDGAGVLDLIGRITLPLSLPGLATLAVLNFIGVWNSFLWPLVMIQDNDKQMIAVGLYKLAQSATSGGVPGWTSRDFSVWGPLYAGYVIASLPLVLLFIVLGKFYVEGLVDSGLKV